MTTWNERLAQALAASEYKPHQFAQALGLKTPSISAWIAAGSIAPAKNLTGENLLRVCKLLEIRPEWLMFNEGPMRPPPRRGLSPEMQEIFETLERIDREGGKERDDALYFMNRLLRAGKAELKAG
jgi:hypothetical protein